VRYFVHDPRRGIERDKCPCYCTRRLVSNFYVSSKYNDEDVIQRKIFEVRIAASCCLTFCGGVVKEVGASFLWRCWSAGGARGYRGQPIESLRYFRGTGTQKQPHHTQRERHVV